MKDPNSAIRSTVIELIIVHYKHFPLLDLGKSFIPALLKELSAPYNFTNNWELENYGQIIEFLIESTLIEECTIQILYDFYNVAEFNDFNYL